jgi:hypothetical protein
MHSRITGMLLVAAIGISPLVATPITITSSGTLAQTVSQTGRLDVSAGFFGGVDMTWDSVGPNLGAGYNWIDVPVEIPGVSIPDGSTIDSVFLNWSRIGPAVTYSRSLISFSGELGGDVTPHPATQTFINWVQGPDVTWLLPLPPPSGPSGSINLIALFGNSIDPYLLSGGGITLGANTQVCLICGSISRSGLWWDSDNVFDTTVSSTVTMDATLIVTFTPLSAQPPLPPDPPASNTPEPATFVSCGLGLIGFASINVRHLRRIRRGTVRRVS